RTFLWQRFAAGRSPAVGTALLWDREVSTVRRRVVGTHEPALAQARACGRGRISTMKRHPDGRYRGNRSPVQVNDRILISRWVETEVIRLKRMGIVSFETIADLLTRAGRGESVPVTMPPGVTFPPDYRISKMGCCKAYRRRMEKEPNLAAAEHRRLDTERCEELFLALQPGIRKGDPRSIDAAARVLGHKAEINGLRAPARGEL